MEYLVEPDESYDLDSEPEDSISTSNSGSEEQQNSDDNFRELLKEKFPKFYSIIDMIEDEAISCLRTYYENHVVLLLQRIDRLR